MARVRYYPSFEEFTALARKGNMVPVYRQLLADTLTPVSAYEKMATGDHSFLLESASGGEKVARYSFLGTSPFMLFRARGDEVELSRALAAGADIIGINNRDIRTFAVDLATTQRLAAQVPAGRLVVSESGINSRLHMAKLRAWGISAALIGEALVTAADPEAKVRELLDQG